MSNTTDIALKLTKNYETCLSALNGALHTYIDSQNSMSVKEFNKLKLKSIEIANFSYQETISKLKAVTEQLCRKERVRAHTDANKKAPKIIVVDADLSHIEAQIKQDDTNALLNELHLAKKLMSQHKLLMASGLTHDSARIKVRERNRGKIMNVQKIDKAGRKIRSNWSLFLNISAFLKQTVNNEYMMQSAKLGFTEFEIVQPDHRRDGIIFSLDNIPEKELHPQSKATIKLRMEV